MSEDVWGCLGFIALLAGGVWLYNHYEIKPKTTLPKVQLMPGPEHSSPRPTGMQLVTEQKSGSIWRLNADSVF